MSDTPKLLGCPFCGLAPTIVAFEVASEAFEYAVRCNNCRLLLGTAKFYTTKQQSWESGVAAWNRRAPSPLDKLAMEVADRSDEYWTAYDKWVDAHADSEETYKSTCAIKDRAFFILMKILGEFREARRGKA